MLTKLLKHDLHNLLILVGPLYLVALCLTVTNGIIYRLNVVFDVESSFISGYIISTIFEIFGSFSGFAIFAIMPVTAILFAAQLYKSLFSREGYLTNTLPVTAHQIILSKTLAGAIVTVCSTLAIAALGFLFVAIIDPEALAEALADIPDILDFFGYLDEIGLIIISSLALGLVMTFFVPLHATFSFALGHLTRYKVVMSIVYYVVLQNFVVQAINAAIMIFWSNNEYYFLESPEAMSQMIFTFALAYAVLSVVFYFASVHILDKKLNLT
ncbi:MAG: hypothetical protein R3Y07_06235 [Eubacteriales bacterium]